MKYLGALPPWTLFAIGSCCCQTLQPNRALPFFDYSIARIHELQPHRRTIPIAGVGYDSSTQLALTLRINERGEVLSAKADGDRTAMKLWAKVHQEVMAWKFTPFISDGAPSAARVEEYVDLVPPERPPIRHVDPPILKPDSNILISLSRSGCFGTCPSYKVSIRPEEIDFEGRSYVVARGTHKVRVDPDKVRALARRFIASDFYSFQDEYRAGVSDNPAYFLCISIDGHKKQVVDYVGSWVGMPAVVTELEDAVDQLADTGRWIEGANGLASALTAEGFNFHSVEAQLMLRRASDRGQKATVHDLINAGVPLDRAPTAGESYSGYLELGPQMGVLTSANNSPDILKELIHAGVSKGDQEDKDQALSAAARSGNLESVELLIAYGANPNADLRTVDQKQHPDRDAYKMNGPGSVLIQAAYSGNPDVVREILKYHPDLEARGFRQRTALFFVEEPRSSDKPGQRVESAHLLVQAGANVNATDYDGDTPLHQVYLTDVEEELLKLGADVNARNKEGDTPIVTNVDNDCVALFIEHGADLTIRNKKGETIMQAAKHQGPLREAALRKALARYERR